ncbi:hypothetical protein Trydic_g1576 [Trypoxylus dichotomus]
MLKLSLGVLLLCYSSEVVRSKLLSVHIIFRHGEKTPEPLLMLPNDPYRNQSFYPFGPGQLTNVNVIKVIATQLPTVLQEGKRTMYDLGKTLRKRYHDFLGDIYTPDALDAWASSFDRCHASLQIVLAALFPPKGPQVWEESLNWQPITYKSLLREDDDLFMGVLKNDFVKLYEEYYSGEEGKKISEEIQPLLSYINAHSNATMKTLRDLMIVYAGWSSEEEYGLTLPVWSKKIYPQPLSDTVTKEYALHVETKAMARKATGKLVKKILADSEKRFKRRSNYKLHLYAAHDVTIAHILTFLKIKYERIPEYAATLILELHEKNGVYFIEESAKLSYDK